MVYLLPGMGGTGEMYAGPWRDIPGAVFVDWPEYRGEKEIQEVAARVVEEHGIRDGDTVIGTSLGGMVACGISRIARLRRLVLVGGVRHPDEVSGLLRLFHPLAGLAPLEFVRRAAGKAPGELARMFAEADAEFVRAMCFAVFRWRGLDLGGVRPVRIHGRRDRVVPLPKDVDLVIDGGHLIAMTHAGEFVDWLGEQGIVE